MEKLIKKVQENRLLYDDKSTYYRDTDKRYQVWNKIGRELNLSAEEARSTWDRLRRSFINARNRRRVKEHESGVVIHPWKYEKEMAFLWPFVERNRKILENSKLESTHEKSTLNDALLSQDTTSVWIPSPCNDNSVASELDEQVKSEIEEAEENTNVPSDFLYEEKLENAPSSSPMVEDNSTFGNKRKYSHYFDDYTEKVSPMKRRLVMHEKSIFDMDEHDLFFLSMSKMTKSLPTVIERAKVKLAVSNAVLQALIDSNLAPS